VIQIEDGAGYAIGLLMLLCVAVLIMLISIEMMERRQKERLAKKEEEIAVLREMMTEAATEREQLRAELSEFMGLPRRLLEGDLPDQEVK